MNFALHIEASLPAKNLDSANKKTEDLKEWMRRQGWEAPEIRLKGQA